MKLFAKLRSPRLPPKRVWPDPELSTGPFIEKVDGRSFWQATGPAREAFISLGPDIDTYLQRNSEPILDNRVNYTIFMIGKSPKSTIPTVVFCCDIREHRVHILNLIKSSGLLDQYPGMRTGHMPRPPKFTKVVSLSSSRSQQNRVLQSEPLGQNGSFFGSESRRQSDYRWRSDASTHEDLIRLSPTNALGKRIRIKNDSENSLLLREATIGGVVQIGYRYFYMTAAHPFQKPIHFIDEGQGESGEAFEFDDEFNSGDESPDEEDVGMTSRGSQTPEEETSKNENSGDEISGTSSRAVESQSSFIALRAAQLWPVATRSGLEIGKTFITSYSGKHSDLDYALIEAEGGQTRGINRILDANGVLLLQISDIVTSGPRQASVRTWFERCGVLDGTLSGTPTYSRPPGAKHFQELFTVYFDGPLEVGDCGSWVVDGQSGDLFGHIVAGNPTNGVAYIVPASQVFRDITDLVHDNVRLPFPNFPTDRSSCPYHAPILNGTTTHHNGTYGVRRYLNEGPGEQYAMFIRPDNGQLSTSRECRCVGVGMLESSDNESP